MRLDGRVWWGAILLYLSLLANAGDPVASFNDAKAYAQGTVDGTGGIVSAEKAATLPHYSPNSPVPELVPGSAGINAAGVAKINGCQGQNDTECTAVNFLAKNPNQRLRFNIDPAHDQILQVAKQVQGNPMAVAGNALNGLESACTTRTETTQAQYTTETCTTLRTIEGQQCTIGRVVNIDADSNFQCDQTVSAYETLRCRRAHSFNIGLVPGCTPGQHINRVTADPCPQCYDYLIWDFTCQSTGYLMHFWTAYHGTTTLYMDLGTRTVPGAVGTNTGRTLGPNSHEGGYCYSTYYTQVCGSTTCTITAEFYNECQGTSYSGNSTFQMPMINGLLGIARTSTCDTLESRSR